MTKLLTPEKATAKPPRKKRVSKKKIVIEQLFKHCSDSGDATFSNELVKEISTRAGFKNPFDVTKIDNTDVLPDILIDNDVFISHLGKGRHCFVPKIRNGYHAFEEIDEQKQWLYKKSLLNEFDDSESNILSVAFNQGIIHDFLYPDDRRANPNIYGAKRTKDSFAYMIGQTSLHMDKVQMEIDMTMEYGDEVTVFEGKNNFPRRFAVYQIFHPYLYYHYLKTRNGLPIKRINCCYLLRKKAKAGSVIRVYLYTFTDPRRMRSIKLLKSTEYQLLSSGGNDV